MAVNEPIDNPQAVRSITLRVLGNSNLVANWHNVQTSDNQTLIRSMSQSRKRTASEAIDQYVREELSYPISAAAVQELA